MLLATLTTIATLATTHGSTCAVINNVSNEAAWATPSGQVRTTTYTDMDRIRYADAPGPKQGAAWRALHGAERALQRGDAGPKVRIACRK